MVLKMIKAECSKYQRDELLQSNDASMRLVLAKQNDTEFLSTNYDRFTRILSAEHLVLTLTLTIYLTLTLTHR